MKNIRYIVNLFLSLLILAVASYPCTDKYSSVDSLTTTLRIDADMDSKHSLMDSCSPMCSCNCCATFITIASRLVVCELELKTPVKRYLSSYTSVLQNVDSSIWQPPKIS
ncbi:DUF6660 family protein [Myroides sp. LJL119]